MEQYEVFADGRDRIDPGLFLATLDLMEANLQRVNMAVFEAKEICGTVHCFAGFCNNLTGKSNKPAVLAANRAQASLGLTEEEAETLFYPTNWPQSFKAELKRSRPGTIDYFETVKSRFMHFLKTGE